jgi:hypothetical protein
MRAAHLGRLIHLAQAVSSRRDFLHALAVGAGLAAIGAPDGRQVEAKRRTSKLKRNQFGCVNVGRACRGRDAVCCSGICEGKKPKKGEKDTSACVPHHQGVCTPADRACTDDGSPTSCNPDRPSASCFRTTGHAGFCGDDVIPGCIPCRKDADCRQQLGQGAACVVCAGCPNGATCVPPGLD